MLKKKKKKNVIPNKANKKGKGKKRKRNASHNEGQAALEEAIYNSMRDLNMVSNSQTRAPLNIHPNRLRYEPLKLYMQGFHPHPNKIIFANVIKDQLKLENYIGYYPSNFHIRKSTRIKFYLDRVTPQIPTLDPNRKKNPKPKSLTLPIRKAIKWQCLSSLTAEKMNRSLQ